MITNLSLPFSLFYTLLPHPRIIHSYEITSDSNIEPGNWPRTVQRLESVAEILSIHGARMARENGPIILEEGSIYGERGKMEKKNSWDIVVTRLSFDFILPNHYCP